MAGESTTRKGLIEALHDIGCDAMAVDNESAHPGTADVNWCTSVFAPGTAQQMVGEFQPGAVTYAGWIECKRITAWPKRADTIVRLDHFTQKQKSWITRRCRYSSRVHVLLHVGRGERLLFDGAWAASHLGTLTVEEMYRC